MILMTIVIDYPASAVAVPGGKEASMARLSLGSRGQGLHITRGDGAPPGGEGPATRHPGQKASVQ